MKIVINKCFGGFSLSPQAVKMLAKLNGKESYFFKYDRTDIKKLVPAKMEDLKDDLFFSAFSVPNPPNGTPDNWCEMSMDERKKHNDEYSKIALSQRPENRTDKNLIKVIEKLKSKANGRCAKLKIVEIPDGVDWELDEYDGVETIHETHRSWS